MLQTNPPHLILIDEPELGLHPFALLADLMKLAGSNAQLVVYTQSVQLLNFPEETRNSGKFRQRA